MGKAAAANVKRFKSGMTGWNNGKMSQISMDASNDDKSIYVGWPK